jgi:hypothetical protein
MRFVNHKDLKSADAAGPRQIHHLADLNLTQPVAHYMA